MFYFNYVFFLNNKYELINRYYMFLRSIIERIFGICEEKNREFFKKFKI